LSKPLVVSIPHHLGKDEALRRIRTGLGQVRTSFVHLLAVEEEAWTGDHLQFRVRSLGQEAAGTIDVAEDHVRLEVVLPWLLGLLADRLTPMIRREGILMLEKK
jgi:putative polyhydroxyalkanoic acid system protein